MTDLGWFAKFSGLKPNVSKSNGLWIGSQFLTNEMICPDIELNWVNKIKLLVDRLTLAGADACGATLRAAGRGKRARSAVSVGGGDSARSTAIVTAMTKKKAEGLCSEYGESK